jgi:hypothetical protein
MVFEPTTPELERVKTVHALDRVATAIGNSINMNPKLKLVMYYRDKIQWGFACKRIWLPPVFFVGSLT